MKNALDFIEDVGSMLLLYVITICSYVLWLVQKTYQGVKYAIRHSWAWIRRIRG